MALFGFQGSLQQPDDPARHRIRSPVFRSLVRSIPNDRKYIVLDIGPAWGPNIQFFSRFSCKLYIADVAKALVGLTSGTEEHPVDLGASLRSLLPYDGSERFDAILLWDVVNYLDRAVCRALISHLRGFSHPDTYLHAFISALREIPQEPGSYQIVSDDQIECVFPSEKLHPGPRFTQRDIEKLMPEFAVRRSVLLQSGMQEYMLAAR